MKRIVQCPKCESRLAVFDLGKTISQKCPRCGNAFEIASEEPSSKEKSKTSEKKASKKLAVPAADAATPPPAVAAPAAAAASVQPATPAPVSETASTSPAADPSAVPASSAESAPPANAPEIAAATAAPAASASEDKSKPADKRRLVKPASPPPESAPYAEPHPAHGITFLHIAVLYVLVILSLLMLVVNNLQAKKHHRVTSDNLIAISKQIQSLKK